jgi:hypothetical protein
MPGEETRIKERIEQIEKEMGQLETDLKIMRKSLKFV